jgi:uncharacterized phage-associated protein
MSTPIKFILDEQKAVEAAAFLLKRHGKRMNYTALIKLLYMADRTALLDSGLPITGDYMVSMDNGTVLSGIYDLIRGNRQSRDWNENIKRDEGDRYYVLLVGEVGTKHLSAYELRIIEAIDTKFGSMHWGALCDLTHKFPEWHDPEGSSNAIDPGEILRTKKSSEEAEEILRDAHEFFLLKSA